MKENNGAPWCMLVPAFLPDWLQVLQNKTKAVIMQKVKIQHVFFHTTSSFPDTDMNHSLNHVHIFIFQSISRNLRTLNKIKVLNRCGKAQIWCRKRRVRWLLEPVHLWFVDLENYFCCVFDMKRKGRVDTCAVKTTITPWSGHVYKNNLVNCVTALVN